MKMDFSVGTGRNEPIYEVASIAQTAEECGFSHITFVDMQNFSRDVYAMMTVAALNTHRIQIGHGVTVPLTRHPSVTANATATIDELSGGRAFLGIGTGGNALRSMGLTAPSLQEFREDVEFFKKYTSGQEAQYKGAKMHSEWISRRVPVYMACNGPKACQLAGELADGAVIGGAIHPEVVKWKVGLIEKGAIKAGRDPSQISIWLRTMMYVSSSKEEARHEVSGYAATKARGIYSVLSKESQSNSELASIISRVEPGLIDELKRIYEAYDEYRIEAIDAPHNSLVTQRIIDFVHLTGTPEGICKRIEKLGEIGISNISTTVFTIIDKKGMMQEIGDKIMPHFRN